MEKKLEEGRADVKRSNFKKAALQKMSKVKIEQGEEDVSEEEDEDDDDDEDDASVV